MKILIIGGGFAGCAAAEMLSQFSKFDINIVEKSSFLGLMSERLPMVDTLIHLGQTFPKKKRDLRIFKKIIKLRNCNYHQFKSYVERDNKFYSTR